MNTSNLIIETENLALRPISLDFKNDMFKEFTTEITTYMFPKAPDEIAETVEFIESGMKKNEEGLDFQASMFLKHNNEFIGNCGIHHINTRKPELGIWVKKSAHGHGYGKEAIVALKKWADENLDYEYILYPVDKDNFASKRIPEFLGGKVSREYEKQNAEGRTLHLIEYRIYPNH